MISYKSIIQFWDKFFFSPKPTEGIALFRIVWISIISLYFLFDLENLATFYGPHAILSMETVKSGFSKPHINVFQIFGVSYSTLYLFMGIYALSLFTSLIGFYTRTSLIVVTICMVSLHQRNIWLLSSSETLMRIVSILLVCSPCGHSLSIDSFLSKRSGKPLQKIWAPWALRLIQIQLSVVYVWTVWHKLKGDNWIDGTAVYYATRLESMTNFPMPFVLDSILFIKLATWGALVLEFALGTLVWIKEFRKPVIFAGLFFHLGIEYMMSIPFFEIIMMALILNYFTPEELKAFVDQMRESFVKGVNDSPLASGIKKKLTSITPEVPTV